MLSGDNQGDAPGDNSGSLTTIYWDIPRQFPKTRILAGTTNEESPIPYEGEGTRYWPVKVIEYNRDYLLSVRDQLWAEAKGLYQAGQKWWVDNETLLKAIGEARDEFKEDNPMVGKLRSRLLGISRITMSEVLDMLEVPVHLRDNRGLRTSIGSALRALQFKKARETTQERDYFYCR